MDTTTRFWDRIADKYARSPIADEAAYQTKLDITRSLMRPDMEMLEFGCGTGSTAILHAAHVGHITAVDFSAAMLKIARERARAAKVDNITFLEADIASFPIDEGRYDMVMAMSLLHLLKEPEAAIGNIFSMLKPGGYFISSTACLTEIMPIIRPLAPLGRALGLLPQLKVFSSAELIAMMERQGFSVMRQWQPKKKAALFVVAQKPRD